jgi:hypothetical protein
MRLRSATTGNSAGASREVAAISETLGQNGRAQTTTSTINSSITVQATMIRCAG